MEDIVKDKVAIVRDLVEKNPDGVAVSDIEKITKLRYPAIKRIVDNLNFTMEKRRILRYRRVLVVKKKEEVYRPTATTSTSSSIY